MTPTTTTTTTTTTHDRRRSVVILEHGKSEACYVTTFQGPRAVWQGWTDGNAPTLASVDSRALRAVILSRGIRWGSYGDPAALPLHVLARWNRGGIRWTGYSHQWRTCDPRMRAYLMASCDTADERAEAQAMGWRVFRVEHDRSTTIEGLRADGEVVCPASAEGGNRADCRACGLCNGASGSTPKPAARTRFAHGTVELWRGKSALDGAPIVALASGLRADSDNLKTGVMVQVWIVRQDIAPHTAQATGDDASVCGECPLRPLLVRAARAR